MIGDLTEQEAYAFSRSVDCARAECLFISCTNFRTIGIIGRLEQELGKPVLSSNLCTAWLAQEALHLHNGEDERAAGCDCVLFRTLAG